LKSIKNARKNKYARKGFLKETWGAKACMGVWTLSKKAEREILWA